MNGNPLSDLSRFSSPQFIRSLTLVGAILGGLAGGTNYVFSAYAPQLASKLRINHTMLNVVALAGNIGVYSTGPLWGMMADTRGPRILFITACCLLLPGYLGVKAFYDGTFSLPEDDPDSFSLPFLCLVAFAYASGAGGNAGLTGSINATARSFSDKSRSTAVGLVASGFGLSAFFFSTLAHTAFADDTSGFLLTLALGTTIPMFLGIFIVNIVPFESNTPASRGSYTPLQQDSTLDDSSFLSLDRRLTEMEDERRNASPAATERADHTLNPRTGLPYDLRRSSSSTSLDQDDLLASKRRTHFKRPSPLAVNVRSRSPSFDAVVAPLSEVTPLSPENLYHPREGLQASLSRYDLSPSSKPSPPAKPHSWREVLSHLDFWVLFFLVSLLAGTGLMWINNVGSMTQVLVAQGHQDSEWDEEAASRMQSTQVSTVSVLNCAGRIFMGFAADHAKHAKGYRRVVWFIPISLVAMTSQIVALNTDSAGKLWMSSGLLGFGYGAMFVLAPMVVLEWFGLESFSRNWGLVAFSPVIGGNTFSLAFGRNLDKHASPGPSDLNARAGIAAPADGDHMCFEGVSCYASSLRMTIGACAIALLLSLWAIRRDAAHATREVSESAEENDGRASPER